jgi:exopolysaccharide production protein ExoZ
MTYDRKNIEITHVAGKIPSLQILRAIAACSVVLTHAVSRYDRQFPMELETAFLFSFSDFVVLGNFGVDLFFVISGFLMFHAHQADFGRPGAIWYFLLRRLVRIVPIYWILTTIGLILLAFAPTLFTHHKGIEWQWVIGNYLFIPLPMSDGMKEPVIGAGWTLGYEMHFYWLFAFTLIFRQNVGPLFLMVILLSSIIFGRYLEASHPWINLVTSWFLLEFIFGMLVCILIKKVQLCQEFAIVCLTAAVLTILMSGFSPPIDLFSRVLQWGLPSAVILWSILSLNLSCSGFLSNILVLIGDASYSIYLFQVFSLPAFAILMHAIAINTFICTDGAILILAIMSMCAGFVFWRFVEHPITNYLRLRLL